MIDDGTFVMASYQEASKYETIIERGVAGVSPRPLTDEQGRTRQRTVTGEALGKPLRRPLGPLRTRGGDLLHIMAMQAVLGIETRHFEHPTVCFGCEERSFFLWWCFFISIVVDCCLVLNKSYVVLE